MEGEVSLEKNNDLREQDNVFKEIENHINLSNENNHNNENPFDNVKSQEHIIEPNENHENKENPFETFENVGNIMQPHEEINHIEKIEENKEKDNILDPSENHEKNENEGHILQPIETSEKINNFEKKEENQEKFNNGEEDEDDFGEFEESQIDNKNIQYEKESQKNDEEHKNESIKQELTVLQEKPIANLKNLLHLFNSALFDKDFKCNSDINNEFIPEKVEINKNIEKIPLRISHNFKEIFTILLKKEIFKKKLSKNLKVPLEQDDKLFSLKIIDDLNKLWEGLNYKKILKETAKIKSPDYDFFLEELTKADFKKKKTKNSEKFQLIIPKKANITEIKNYNDECIISNDLFENLNKPLSNYNYSAILNQNFTENFKLKHPLDKRIPLKKALSNVLEENEFIMDLSKGLEKSNSNSAKKNSLNSPVLEKQIIENILPQLPKKISIDGMNVFGFEIDLEANDKSNNTTERKSSEITQGNPPKDSVKTEENVPEIKNILPNYEDIFN